MKQVIGGYAQARQAQSLLSVEIRCSIRRNQSQDCPALPSFGFRKGCTMHERQECESRDAAAVDAMDDRIGPKAANLLWVL